MDRVNLSRLTSKETSPFVLFIHMKKNDNVEGVNNRFRLIQPQWMMRKDTNARKLMVLSIYQLIRSYLVLLHTLLHVLWTLKVIIQFTHDTIGKRHAWMTSFNASSNDEGVSICGLLCARSSYPNFSHLSILHEKKGSNWSLYSLQAKWLCHYTVVSTNKSVIVYMNIYNYQSVGRFNFGVNKK